MAQARSALLVTVKRYRDPTEPGRGPHIAKLVSTWAPCAHAPAAKVYACPSQSPRLPSLLLTFLDTRLLAHSLGQSGLGRRSCRWPGMPSTCVGRCCVPLLSAPPRPANRTTCSAGTVAGVRVVVPASQSVVSLIVRYTFVRGRQCRVTQSIPKICGRQL
jgi:hypothetical protein